MEIKKLNEEKQGNKPFPIFRAIFLFLIILLGLLGSYVLGTKHPQKKQEQGFVLGEQIKKKGVVESAVKGVVDQSVKQLEKGTQGLVKEAQKVVTDTVNQTSNEARGFVFDNTVGKLLETIHTLPIQEQERVKKYICN